KYLEEKYGSAATEYVAKKIGEGKQFVRDFGTAAMTPSSSQEEAEGLGVENYSKAGGYLKEKASEAGKYLKATKAGQTVSKGLGAVGEFASRKQSEWQAARAEVDRLKAERIAEAEEKKRAKKEEADRLD